MGSGIPFECLHWKRHSVLRGGKHSAVSQDDSVSTALWRDSEMCIGLGVGGGERDVTFLI